MFGLAWQGRFALHLRHGVAFRFPIEPTLKSVSPNCGAPTLLQNRISNKKGNTSHQPALELEKRPPACSDRKSQAMSWGSNPCPPRWSEQESNISATQYEPQGNSPSKRALPALPAGTRKCCPSTKSDYGATMKRLHEHSKQHTSKRALFKREPACACDPNRGPNTAPAQRSDIERAKSYDFRCFTATWHLPINQGKFRRNFRATATN